VKVLDVKTKKLLKSASSKGDGVSSILKTQIDELSREISQGIGITGQTEKAAQLQIADVTTNSMEAYNYLLKGIEAREKLYYDDSRKFLEKAVEIDPTFAVAYLHLGIAYHSLRKTKARNEAFEKAKTLSTKTTDKERLTIEANYAMRIEGNIDKTLQILEERVKKYPKEKRFHFVLGWYYQHRNRDKGIEECNKALELDPSYGSALNMLGYYYMDGDNEKALEYFKRYASVSPGDANPPGSMADVYYKMGRLDEAIAKCKESLEIKPDFHWSMEALQYIYALKEDYSEAMKWVDKLISTPTSPGIKSKGYLWKGFHHYWLGSLGKSLVDLQRAADMAESTGDDVGKAFVDFLRGWIYYDRGEFELSRKYFEGRVDVYIENDPDYRLYYEALYSFSFGSLDLEEGRIDSAKARLAEMKSVIPETWRRRKNILTFFYNHLHAQVLLKEDSPEKAIAVFEKASSLRTPVLQLTDAMILYNIPFLKDVLARAYQHKGELDKAISEYERFVTFDPNSESRRLIHPKYHYRLAKLYEQKGWKGKAIEHYEKFLDLWKDADPGIAEVEEARRRVAGLKNK